MAFDIELRVRINDDLDKMVEKLLRTENQPSRAALVRQLIKEKYEKIDDEQAAPAKTVSNDLEEVTEAATISSE